MKHATLSKWPASRQVRQPTSRGPRRKAQDCSESTTSTNSMHRNAQDCRESTTFTNSMVWAQLPKQHKKSERYFFNWSSGFSMFLLAHVLSKASNLNTFALFSCRFCNIKFLCRRDRIQVVNRSRFRANCKLQKMQQNLCEIDDFVVFATSKSSKYSILHRFCNIFWHRGFSQNRLLVGCFKLTQN